MPNIAKMKIVTCCSDHVEYVNFIVPDDHEYCENFHGYSLCYEYRCMILRRAGYDGSVECKGCNNNSHSVRFVEWVERDGEIRLFKE